METNNVIVKHEPGYTEEISKDIFNGLSPGKPTLYYCTNNLISMPPVYQLKKLDGFVTAEDINISDFNVTRFITPKKKRKKKGNSNAISMSNLPSYDNNILNETINFFNSNRNKIESSDNEYESFNNSDSESEEESEEELEESDEESDLEREIDRLMDSDYDSEEETWQQYNDRRRSEIRKELIQKREEDREILCDSEDEEEIEIVESIDLEMTMETLFENFDFKACNLFFYMVNNMKNNNIKFEADVWFDRLLDKEMDVNDKIKLIEQIKDHIDFKKPSKILCNLYQNDKISEYDVQVLFEYLLSKGVPPSDNLFKYIPTTDFGTLNLLIANDYDMDSIPDIYLLRICKENPDKIGEYYESYFVDKSINEVMTPDVLYVLYKILSDEEIINILEILMEYSYDFDDIRSTYFFPHIYYAIINKSNDLIFYLANNVHQSFEFIKDIILIDKEKTVPLLYYMIAVSSFYDEDELFNDICKSLLSDEYVKYVSKPHVSHIHSHIFVYLMGSIITGNNLSIYDYCSKRKISDMDLISIHLYNIDVLTVSREILFKNLDYLINYQDEYETVRLDLNFYDNLINVCFIHCCYDGYDEKLMDKVEILCNKLGDKLVINELYISSLLRIICLLSLKASCINSDKTIQTVYRFFDIILKHNIQMTGNDPVLVLAARLVYKGFNGGFDIGPEFLTQLLDKGFSKDVKVNNRTYLNVLGEYSVLFDTPIESVYINNQCCICLEKKDKLCYSDKCGHAVVCFNCYSKSDKSKCVMCQEAYGKLKFINLLY